MTQVPINSRAGIPLRYANRHGLVTGATGSGKSVSLMRLADEFSRAGVPAFVADVKGDLAALSRSCPAELFDLFGQAGKPVCVPIGSFGADLLSRALELSDVQAGALEIVLAYADEMRLPVSTIDDLRAVLQTVIVNREAVSIAFGQVSAASVGVIQRALLRLEKQGARSFFGQPAFDVAAFLESGKVSILAADRLMESPQVYSAFLLWLLSELYSRLPEIGDIDQPRLVFFFDEAHLLFRDCPAALLARIEQTVRLIRSKGVGVYFVSQSPEDVPILVREQLAHKLAHSRDLPIGVARFSTLDDHGRPVAETVQKVDLPGCQLGALSDVEKRAFVPEPATLQPVPSITAPLGQDMPAPLELTLYGLAVAALALIVGGIWFAVSHGLGGYLLAAMAALIGARLGVAYGLAAGICMIVLALMLS